MKWPIVDVLAGTTLKAAWVNSGAVPSPIISCVYDRNEALISSVAATASGNGFYYAVHPLPNSSAWYVNKWFATINASTYVNAQLVRAIAPEVD